MLPYREVFFHFNVTRENEECLILGIETLGGSIPVKEIDETSITGHAHISEFTTIHHSKSAFRNAASRT